MEEKNYYSKNELMELKEKDYVQDIIRDCFCVDTSYETEVGLINEIHELVDEDYDSAVHAFWIVFYVNPKIAIRAYQDCILFKKISLYTPFKYAVYRIDEMATLNPYVQNYVILGIEAMLQRRINVEEILGDITHYIELLYNHDREIMYNKFKQKYRVENQEKKWLSKRNILHILSNIDPKFIIVLLEFFTDRYKRRLHNGGNEKSYSGYRYQIIVDYIREKHGSLSEYIEWDNNNVNFFYKKYYKLAMERHELQKDLSVVFATDEDMKRIREEY